MLAPGNKLGPYEIVAPLGAGGMGEVYRARDTRLGRDVAVKVLPQHLSSSPEVRARFEREAKTVSGLNHPNICTLFDVGREGDTDYLVMELVEGETLAERLKRGPLPAAELLRFATQIADALDRAHRSNIIHRDLKPGNVMLTKSGAKLMDFGLARATGLAGPAGASGVTVAALTRSPTVAAPLTAEGTILGTFQYMAPEQLEGKEADARSDLWAFGCVLYEMATGKRPFEGRSQASLISAIMSWEPPPISQLTPMAPPALERVVQACLAKDPDERIQTAHDLKLQLQWVAGEGSQSGAALGTAPAAGRGAGSATRERIAWTLAVLGLAVGALASLGLLARLGAPRPVQLSLTPPEGLRLDDLWSSHAISPDGRFVVFNAHDTSGINQLWLRPLDSPTATPLPGTRDAFGPFWSPDSRFIAFFTSADSKLKKISVSGGTVATICDARWGRGGSWGRAGVIVFAPDPQGPLFRVGAGGAEPAQVTTLDSSRHEIGQRFPCFLPDGDHFLYASLPPGPHGWDIYAGSLKSKAVKKVMIARSSAVYVEPGDLLFMRDAKVMAQRFDARRLALVGDPVALGDAPAATNTDAEPVASASRDGRLLFLRSRLPDTRLEWLDRTGTVRGVVPLPPGPWQMNTLSPDARFAAVVNGDDIWRVDLGRALATRLTSNGASNYGPVWSPDGRWIAYTASRAGREEIEIVDATGGEPRRLETTGDLFKNACGWSPDGQTLVFADLQASTSYDLWTVPVSGAGKAVRLLGTRFLENGGQISPDGRWIAYVCDESGRREVFVQSYPTAGHKVQISTGGGLFPTWLRGGAELGYWTTEGSTVMAVPVSVAGAELHAGEPRVLFQLPRGSKGADVSLDGERALVDVPALDAQDRSLNVVLGWKALAGR